MISIRSNFFYSRSVPCELWFFDRGKPNDRRDEVLMIDARNVYRKVTRKINDFSPEQLTNLSAIVWLHRGQRSRFLKLLQDYFAAVCRESKGIRSVLSHFDMSIAALEEVFANVRMDLEKSPNPAHDPFYNADDELGEALTAYGTDRGELESALSEFARQHEKTPPGTNDKQRAAREAFDPTAERLKGLMKQVDLIYKLAARMVDAMLEVVTARPADDPDNQRDDYEVDRRRLSRLLKEHDASRKAAVEQLKAAAYFHKQIAWLQDRFPKAELQAVPGLVKLVDRKEIEAADWSLTPGRYVGVAPPEQNEDFDFEQTIRDIHTELADLNKEAAELAAKIQENLEEVGA